MSQYGTRYALTRDRDTPRIMTRPLRPRHPATLPPITIPAPQNTGDAPENHTDDASAAVSAARRGAPDENAGAGGEVVWPPSNEGWPPWARAFLEAFSKLPNVAKAAERVGVNRSSVNRLAARDEAFAVAKLDAHERALDLMEEVVFARATHGLPMSKTVTTTRRYKDKSGDEVVETTTTETRDVHVSDNLAMFYLKRYRPEFRDSFRVEQTGAGGGPIRHEVTQVDEAVAAFRGELERLGTAEEPERA